MKVTNSKAMTHVIEVVDRTENASRVRASKSKPDRVSLSQEVQQMQKADIERVQALSKEIAEGRYTIDLVRLAQAIITKESL